MSAAGCHCLDLYIHCIDNSVAFRGLVTCQESFAKWSDPLAFCWENFLSGGGGGETISNSFINSLLFLLFFLSFVFFLKILEGNNILFWWKGSKSCLGGTQNANFGPDHLESNDVANYEMRNHSAVLCNLHPSVPKAQSKESKESISYFQKALTELY